MVTTIILAAALPVAGILGYALRSYFGKIKLNSAEADRKSVV